MRRSEPHETSGEEKRAMAAESTALNEAVAQRESHAAAQPDREILDAVAEGNHRVALSLCARTHGLALGRLCMALVGSRAEADDLVQETLLDAHSAFGSYRGDGSVRAWLFAIARRKCARHLERRTMQRAKLTLVHDSDKSPPALDGVLERERATRARAALATLRPSEREALVLRFLCELDFHEVGRACGIDEVAARKRVSRALCRLREIVGRSGE
jgi:RNA polymerase sigma-70 factor (ECF subfamily)